MPVSDSYYESLIESLKNPSYAAVYLETHLEGDEYGFDPELLKLALSHVLEALGSQVMTREQIKIQANQLDELMEKPGKEALNSLESWLKSLGLKLTVTVSEDEKEIPRKPFESHFGEIDCHDSKSIDNESIDGDLAQEYLNNPARVAINPGLTVQTNPLTP